MRIDRKRISTGVGRLDDALDGGFKEGSLIELYCRNGTSTASKNLYNQIAVLLGIEGEGSLFISSLRRSLSHDYTRARIARRFGLGPKESASIVTSLDDSNGYRIDDLLEALPELLERYSDYRLIVVDDYTKLFKEPLHTAPHRRMRRTWEGTTNAYYYVNTLLNRDGQREKLFRLLKELRSHARRTGAICVVVCSDRLERFPHGHPEVDCCIGIPETTWKDRIPFAINYIDCGYYPVRLCVDESQEILVFGSIFGLYDTPQELELERVLNELTMNRNHPRPIISFTQVIEDAMKAERIDWPYVEVQS